MQSVHLYLAQRICAMIMAPLVFIHLGVIIYAIQGGLSAEEILGRTRGSVFWMLFYGLFVAAASLHAAIGLRVIAQETLRLRGMIAGILAWGVFAVFFFMGARAVTAVTMI
ncbi:MAG: succinate dehydrogenase [Roseovarius sp.]|nr:succinate dehydrogenase [Roseovarius sp.]MCY4208405.1 succinate dehydrogenase [Roseovarius sp.]MCY4314842.1 succinate dehydrogenase [Roseovarius sp.]